MSHSRQMRSGFTLIEVVIAIAVMSVGLVALLSVFTLSVSKSADPVLQLQANAVAQGYIEEIMLKEYTDPDGTEVGESRSTFDDVDDYTGLVANGCLTTSAACPVLGDCACDQLGDPVAALKNYTVSVTVTGTTLNGETAQLIDVTVSHQLVSSVSVSVSSYRTNY